MVLRMMTKYAKKILEIVESSNDHLTAEQIFMQLRETYPTVVLAIGVQQPESFMGGESDPQGISGRHGGPIRPNPAA